MRKIARYFNAGLAGGRLPDSVQAIHRSRIAAMDGEFPDASADYINSFGKIYSDFDEVLGPRLRVRFETYRGSAMQWTIAGQMHG